jgi:hypothetical protein
MPFLLNYTNRAICTAFYHSRSLLPSNFLHPLSTLHSSLAKCIQPYISLPLVVFFPHFELRFHFASMNCTEPFFFFSSNPHLISFLSQNTTFSLSSFVSRHHFRLFFPPVVFHVSSYHMPFFVYFAL